MALEIKNSEQTGNAPQRISMQSISGRHVYCKAAING